MLIRLNVIITMVSVSWMSLRYLLRKKYSHQNIYAWESMYWSFLFCLCPIFFMGEEIKKGLMGFNEVNLSLYLPQASAISVRKIAENRNILQVTDSLERILWLFFSLGAAAFLVFCLRHRRLSRPLREAIPHKAALYGCSDFLKKIGVDKVWVSEAVLSPLTWGIFKGKIMVSSYFSKNYQEEDDLILLHEAIHLQRRDNLKKFLILAFTFLFWYNPLLWAQYFFFQKEVELSCDEKVLSHAGEGACKAYIGSLLKYAKSYAYKDLLVSPSSDSNLKRRIITMLNNKKRKKVSLCISGFLGIFLLSICLFATFSSEIFAKRTDSSVTADSQQVVGEKPFIEEKNHSADSQSMPREVLKGTSYDRSMEEVDNLKEEYTESDTALDEAGNDYNYKYNENIVGEQSPAAYNEEAADIVSESGQGEKFTDTGTDPMAVAVEAE